MKNLILACLIIISTLVLSGCDWRGAKADYAASILRTDKEVADSALRSDGINSQVALKTISDNAGKAANKIDPDNKNQPITTADKIVTAEKIKLGGQPNPELQKIYQFVDAGPGSGSFGWMSILGFGAVALGVIAKFVPPGPWNIPLSLAQMAAQKFLPDYQQNKAVATSVVVSVDQWLSEYGALLETMPQTKAELTTKLGMDPVVYAKMRLSQITTDLGHDSAVSTFMDGLKAELTTQNGVLTPSATELDQFLSKKI